LNTPDATSNTEDAGCGFFYCIQNSGLRFQSESHLKIHEAGVVLAGAGDGDDDLERLGLGAVVFL